MTWGGHKESGGTGWGGAGSQRQGLLNPKMKKANECKDGRGHPLDFSRAPARTIRRELEEKHCGDQGSGLGASGLEF